LRLGHIGAIIGEEVRVCLDSKSWRRRGDTGGLSRFTPALPHSLWACACVTILAPAEQPTTAQLREQALGGDVVAETHLAEPGGHVASHVFVRPSSCPKLSTSANFSKVARARL
jgi:hypothetical protein